KDVIGDWIPASESTPKIAVQHAGLEWIEGLQWDEIDDNFKLIHPTSARECWIEADLTKAPMVLEEIGMLSKFEWLALRPSGLPRRGPVVTSEATALPWSNSEYRRKWRMIADAVGVPRCVKNMDSRAGAKIVRIAGLDFRDFERRRP